MTQEQPFSITERVHMKLVRWKLFWGAGLIVLSAFFYFIHYLIFRDLHHIFIYMVGDIAFVFIEVLLVTVIIHELLNYRAEKTKLNKLNMIIGVFFSEIGTELLRIFSEFDRNTEKMKGDFASCKDWLDQQFSGAHKACRGHEYEIDIRKGNLELLRNFLLSKRYFMVDLLQNPWLLEHDTFSDLLWAVFHLVEELSHRENVKDLKDADYKHIASDIERAYVLLTTEWLVYMKHLKDNYPYLFSLAIRTNPFDPDKNRCS